RLVKTFILRFESNFAVACIRLAVHDEREDPVFAAELLKRFDFFADPARVRGAGRADHDQVTRFAQRFLDVRAEVGRNGKLFAVAKNWKDPRRNFPVSRLLSDKAPRNAISLQRLVQPIAPLPVGVAVAEERPVFQSVRALPAMVKRPRHDKQNEDADYEK